MRYVPFAQIHVIIDMNLSGVCCILQSGTKDALSLKRMELKYKSISNSFLLELSLNIKERLMCQKKKRALQYCVIFFS